MQNGSINIKTIPQKYINDLKEAGIDFASDGNLNDLSAKDIIGAYKKCSTDYNNFNKYTNMINKLDPFLTWFFENNTGKACIMENEIRADDSTNLAGYFCAVYSRIKATIKSRNILRKNNINLVLDKEVPTEAFKDANLDFKITDGKLIITGREFQSKSWLGPKEYKSFKYEVNKPQLSTLKEISIKKSGGDPSMLDKLNGLSKFQYVLSTVYKNGKETPIAILDQYTVVGSGHVNH